MKDGELRELLAWLRAQPTECEWLEFKKDYHSNEEIGKDISSLANGARLLNLTHAYLVFGIRDGDHEVIGTSFRPKIHKVGNEDFIHWLARMLDPSVDFQVFELEDGDRHLTIFKITSAIGRPVRFQNHAYIRVHSVTRPLNDFPEKEQKLWHAVSAPVFENQVALGGLTQQQVVNLINIPVFYELINQAAPNDSDKGFARLIKERLIVKNGDKFDITNLGALVLAYDLSSFSGLQRRAIRVVEYNGRSRTVIKSQIDGVKGYAVGFTGLIDYINKLIPENEVIKTALRTKVKMYPEIAIRELVANAIIHQDFNEVGAGPVIEIFSDRIEVTNAGIPLLSTDRFIDSNLSRNENLALLLRRLRICEDLGSGWDKVVEAVEAFQLPPATIIKLERQTKAIIFAYKTFNNMDRDEKVTACFQHACLKWVLKEKMNNQSLRGRFGIEQKNAANVSRIISDTLREKLIKEADPDNKSLKFVSYIPYWV